MAAKKKTTKKKEVVEEIFGEVPEIAKSDAELLGLKEDVDTEDAKSATTRLPTVEATLTAVGEPSEVVVEVIDEEKAVDDTIAEIALAEEGLKELIAKKKEALPRCGHVNAHSNGIDGKPDGLTCTRYERHPGNHRALHTEMSLENPEETTEYEREWSNAVDLPAVVQPVEDPNVPGWVQEREPTRYVEIK